VKVVLLFLEQEFKFLHEQARYDFVFALFEAVKTIEGNLFGHFADNISVDAGHVNLNPRDLLDVFADEV
jgi:hypothetical protein